jgi:hypothetical protein
VRLVINASPWIFLAKIDLLSLLPSCFSPSTQLRRKIRTQLDATPPDTIKR